TFAMAISSVAAKGRDVSVAIVWTLDTIATRGLVRAVRAIVASARQTTRDTRWTLEQLRVAAKHLRIVLIRLGVLLAQHVLRKRQKLLGRHIREARSYVTVISTGNRSHVSLETSARRSASKSRLSSRAKPRYQYFATTGAVAQK